MTTQEGRPEGRSMKSSFQIFMLGIHDLEADDS
jgi:hypothetical protein